MKKITIFGCGWLGEPLADFLFNKGFEVAVTVKSAASLEKLKDKPYAVFQADIELVDDIPERVFQSDIFIVDIPFKVVKNFESLINRIRLSNVQHTLYVSSTSVYSSNNDWVNEIDGPMNEGSAIYQVEAVFRKALPDTTFIRFSGLIGPKRHPGRFFQRAGKSIAEPEAPVNFIHLKDCIGLISEVIHQKAWGKTFNGCGPHHPIKREFYTWAAPDAGYAIPEMGNEDALSYKKVDGSLVTEILGYDYQVKDFYQSNIYRTLE